MPTLADIQIVTVAYNSSGVIGDMLATVPDGPDVVIVDNASSDTDALGALATTHGARVVTNSENRGFGAACNLGAAQGTHPWLFFLNPDAQMQEGCLEALLRATSTHPQAGAFSPQVRDGKGRPAFRRRSRLLPKSAHWHGPVPQQDSVVPLLNGAAVFVSRDHFEAVGGFDDTIFLYHEDDDLSLRLAAQCGPLIHVHAACVTHAEGHSTARTPATAAFKAYHMGQSALYAMRKHNRPKPRLSVGWLALTGLLSPLNLLSARKRAKAMGFARGVFGPDLAKHSDGNP